MSTLGRGLAWLPDIAATLLAVVLVLVAVAFLGQQSENSAAPLHRQVPAGPIELVEAFWQVLHPEGRPVLVLTAEGERLDSVPDGTEPLVFVLAQDNYPEAVAALRAAGIPRWREISVPPALGGTEGWNPRFLDLAEAGVTRDEFPAALARVLNQGSGRRSDAGTAQPEPYEMLVRLRGAGNLVLFLSGLALLAWLRRTARV